MKTRQIDARRRAGNPTRYKVQLRNARLGAWMDWQRSWTSATDAARAAATIAEPGTWRVMAVRPDGTRVPVPGLGATPPEVLK